jgi:phytoene dehydrogenase-like protein
MTDAWDFIVIGGGHNGLSAACTIAAAGKSVLVLEQRPILGGLANSHSFLPEAPEHILSMGAMDDLFMSSTSLSSDLGLPAYGHRSVAPAAPYGWLGDDGETLLLFRDFDRTLGEVRRFSEQDARTYHDLRPTLDWLIDAQNAVMVRHPGKLPKAALTKHLLKLAPSKAIRRNLGRMFSNNLVDFAAETFRSDALRSLIVYWGSMIGPVDFDGGGYFCVGLAAVHRTPGLMRPVGGMGSLIRAFERQLLASGGEVRVNTRVARVLTGASGVEGVELDDGTQLRARNGVLASVPPQVAFTNLLEGVLDAATAAKVAMLPASANNVAFFKIDMALSGRVEFTQANRRRRAIDGFDVGSTSLMTGSFEDQIRQLHAMRHGDSLDDLPIYLSILSHHDPTLAPDGQDVLYICADVPAQTRDGWSTSKKWYSEAIMRVAGRHLTGLEHEIGRIETSPADFEALFGTPNGNYFHVDMTPLRYGMNRPAPGLGGYRTPAPGYYLAAAGSHPGGGVSGWAGRLAAQTALSDTAH